MGIMDFSSKPLVETSECTEFIPVAGRPGGKVSPQLKKVENSS
jgi:hypothetical protein